MNRDDIIRMALEADASFETSDSMFKFAALVAAAEREKFAINSIHSCHSECQQPICVLVREAVAEEREECAKIVDRWRDGPSSEPEMAEIAAEIRARGNSEKP